MNFSCLWLKYTIILIILKICKIIKKKNKHHLFQNEILGYFITIITRYLVRIFKKNIYKLPQLCQLCHKYD